MQEQTVIEVSDILDSFNIDEITHLVESQINTDYENDTSTDILTDLFQPLYAKYRAYMDMEIPNEMKEHAESRFISICNIFLDAIEAKFGINLEDDWKDSHKADLPGVVMALYSLFVTEYAANIYDVLVNYIVKNIKFLNQVFDAMKNKKDAASNTYRKDLSPDVALIVANVYDITSWILEQLDSEAFFEYLSEEYIPLRIVKSYYDNAIITGEFMEAVTEIYTKSQALQAKICIDIIANTKNGAIFGDFAMSHEDK